MIPPRSLFPPAPAWENPGKGPTWGTGWRGLLGEGLRGASPTALPSNTPHRCFFFDHSGGRDAGFRFLLACTDRQWRALPRRGQGRRRAESGSARGREGDMPPSGEGMPYSCIWSAVPSEASIAVANSVTLSVKVSSMWSQTDTRSSRLFCRASTAVYPGAGTGRRTREGSGRAK